MDRFEEVFELMAQGVSVNQAVKKLGIPHSSFYAAMAKADTIVLDNYARAREAQADYIFDEILQIADDGQNDTYTDQDGNVKTDHDVIARSRLRVDARKWMAGKMRPKKYGDRLELAGDKENPLASGVLIVPGLAADPDAWSKAVSG